MEDTYCVIDVGTNNVLLIIASVNARINIIKRGSKISALGRDMRDGFLDIEAIDRTKFILTDFIKIAHEFTKKIIVVGTSCSRDAKNISLLSDWLKDKYQINYHIIFGDEEENTILPAVKLAKEEGFNVSGPFPPDTVFYHAAQGRYAAVVCMYHDQGLIPFKLIHFTDGVNTTLGLPIIRTSVDHGTAYDIAGTGKADPGSLNAAIKMAVRQALAAV